jgi:hypothetical protein
MVDYEGNRGSKREYGSQDKHRPDSDQERLLIHQAEHGKRHTDETQHKVENQSACLIPGSIGFHGPTPQKRQARGYGGGLTLERAPLPPSNQRCRAALA